VLGARGGLIVRNGDVSEYIPPTVPRASLSGTTREFNTMIVSDPGTTATVRLRLQKLFPHPGGFVALFLCGESKTSNAFCPPVSG
jgi:hypothetical protein